MSAKIFEAKTVDEALQEAATALGASVDELEHEVVEEKSDDFWGLGETVLAVRVWVAGSEAEAAPPAGDHAAAEQAEPEAGEGSPAEADAPATEAEAPRAAADDAPVSDTSSDDSGDEPTAGSDDETPAGSSDEGEVPDFFSAAGSPEPVEAAAQAVAPAAAEPAPEAAVEAAVEAAPAEPVGDAPEPSPAPKRGAAPLGDADLGDEAVALLGRVFEAMGFDSEATARLDGDTLQIAITGEDNAYLLEGRGRGLSALELVLNHAFRHRDDRAHRRVRVDAGDFRNQREEEIRDLAFQVAHQAKETGEPQQTGSLNPYERRIVHLTLSEDANVTTRSLGNGFMKAVSVIPKQGGRGRR